ncbi:MAG: hypothetical protein Q9219_003241 [cf. Caloplaca sp. 3 TL-2023]
MKSRLTGNSSGICAAIKTSYVPTLTAQSDFTWITVNLLIWNASVCTSLLDHVYLLTAATNTSNFNSNEINVIIWAACCPTLRPLFLQCVQKVKRTIPSHGTGYTRKHGPGYARQGSNEQLKLGYVGAKPPHVVGKNWDYDSFLKEPDLFLPPGRIRQTIDVDVKREQALEEDRLAHGQYGSAFYAQNIV